MKQIHAVLRLLICLQPPPASPEQTSEAAAVTPGAWPEPTQTQP